MGYLLCVCVCTFFFCNVSVCRYTEDNLWWYSSEAVHLILPIFEGRSLLFAFEMEFY